MLKYANGEVIYMDTKIIKTQIFFCVAILALIANFTGGDKKTKETSPTVPTTINQPNGEVISKEPQTPAVKPNEADVHQTMMAALPLTLPQPVFQGTPQNISVDNLEKPFGKPRPDFLAPIGTKNIAAGLIPESTENMPLIGEIDMIADSDREATDGSYVELGPDQQYITFDLGQNHEIYAVLFWHYHRAPRVYFDIVVQVADDADILENVRTIFNNDNDNSTSLGASEDRHYLKPPKENWLTPRVTLHVLYVSAAMATTKMT